MASVNEELALYPIDVENAEEMERLIKQAHLMNEHVGLLPPQIVLAAGQKALDVGCGPGEWALEMAQYNPNGYIVGMDISQRMIAYATACARLRRLSNVEFTVADALEQFLFPDASFDIVHVRFAIGFLQVRTWPLLLKECFRILRPGGMMCNTEFESMGITNSSSLVRYNNLIVEYLRRGQHCFVENGSDIGVIAMQARLLQQSGFTSIHQKMDGLDYSIGLPAHNQMVEDYATLMQLVQPALLREKIISQKELDMLYTQTLADMYADSFCAVTMFQTVWGQKPA